MTLADRAQGLLRALARPHPLANWVLFGLWTAVVLFFAYEHTMWRDEMRALSFAIQGRNVGEMLAGLHGEGHPALWYLMLRGMHLAIGKLALPVTAFLVAAAASALLVWRSPFNLIEKAAILFAKFAIFDYVVVARNYGISMLLAFAFAALYPRFRTRGPWLGLVLLLLANTNVHSVVVAGALMVFWILDIVREHGVGLKAPHRWVVVNGVLAAIGAVLCVLTIYPTFNDAVVAPPREAIGVLAQLASPGQLFPDLNFPGVPLVVVSVLILMALLANADAWPRFVAGLLGFLGLGGLFYFVYPGGYRHECLLFVLLLTLMWIGRASPEPAPSRLMTWARYVGVAGVVGLIALADLTGLRFLWVAHKVPVSRARDFGELVRAQPELAKAVVIADPDYLIEALPYYAPNPVYRIREQQPGPLVKFSKAAIQHLSLDQILATGRRLAAEQPGRPVLILLNQPLNDTAPVRVAEGYSWTFNSTPDQVARFKAETVAVRTMGHALSDETFTVYRLVTPPAAGATSP